MNRNPSSFLLSGPITLSNHLSYRYFELPARCCSPGFALRLCLLADTLCVSIRAVAPLSWRRQHTRDQASPVTPLPCLQTHLCCYNTQRRTHARANTRVFPRSQARLRFYWILFLFLLWRTRSGLVKCNLHTGC